MLYSNPRGLYEFQAGLSAYCILRHGNLAVVDAGLGKTHIAQATTGFLLGEGQIDHAIYVVERNKIEEWEEDFKTFTEMSVNVFHGPKRTLDVDSMVTLTTYHTFRDTLMVDGNLTPEADRFSGRNIMIVFDEAAILGSSRSSDVFRAYERAINLWRKSGANVWVLGLTATPMSTSPENYYNLARIIAPELAMTVKDFGDWYVSVWSKWHKPWRFKNLDHLEERLAPMMLRKRKTDPDVVDQFPKLVEKFVSISLTPSHMKAYKYLDGWIKGLPEEDQPPGFNALNAFACHPRSILSLESKWTRREEWLAEVGVNTIEKMKSAKAEAVIGWIKEILSQDDNSGVLVFCRYVEVLKCLAEDIGSDFPFVEFHGGRSDAENRDAKAAFRDGRAQVMLASSKAERGINLPEAHYIINLDVPLTHSSYVQRYNRGSRIGSNVDGTLMVKTFISRGTIETATLKIWENRNEWSDRMQDTDVDPESEFVSAAMRKAMIKLAQKEGTND